MTSPVKWSLAIAVGAVAGALLRAGLSRWLNTSILTPVGTLLVNVAGSFVMGFLVALFHKLLPPVWFYGATAGFCGSLTTFSSIMLELFEMLRVGQFAYAALYLLLSVVAGLLALAGGYSLGMKWS